MLTISAPIEIKAKTTYLHDPEAFYHRITGNYSLMESRIDEEDLLHIATTPPEIYVTEGEGISSILNLICFNLCTLFIKFRHNITIKSIIKIC